jgi:chemotaxis protein CheD
MIEYKLNIGDVASASGSAKYLCYGLGSCIGLFIHDRSTGFSAGAHILLPDAEECSDDTSKHYNVNGAIAEILRQLKSMGSNLLNLRAKVTGGANVMSMNFQIGDMNINSVRKQLIEHRVFIAAIDVGGSHFRTASYESDTGMMTVKIPQINHFKIL